MGPDFWDSEVWEDQLARHMVIVCTAEILSHALLNAFVRMSQINLLIFDEAHHTKKDHVYARLAWLHILYAIFCVTKCALVSFESHTSLQKSPSAQGSFGMTASPIDAKVDIAEAAM
jgi:ERCC4-like helicases